MEHCNEDFVILSLIPIEIMNKETINYLIKIALNDYNKKILNSNMNDIKHKKRNKKKMIEQLYKFYVIRNMGDKNYIIKFF